MLLFYSQNIDFSYYYHLNYRGVVILHIKNKFQISETELSDINAYDYFRDFKTYMLLLETCKEQKGMTFTRIPIEETDELKTDSDEDK